jgi:hypothetical protein
MRRARLEAVVAVVYRFAEQMARDEVVGDLGAMNAERGLKGAERHIQRPEALVRFAGLELPLLFGRGGLFRIDRAAHDSQSFGSFLGVNVMVAPIVGLGFCFASLSSQS